MTADDVENLLLKKAIAAELKRRATAWFLALRNEKPLTPMDLAQFVLHHEHLPDKETPPNADKL